MGSRLAGQGWGHSSCPVPLVLFAEPAEEPGRGHKNLRGPFPGICGAAVGVPRQTAGTPHPALGQERGPAPPARTQGGLHPWFCTGSCVCPPPGRGRSWLHSLFPRAPCQGRRRWTPGMGEMGAWDGGGGVDGCPERCGHRGHGAGTGSAAGGGTAGVSPVSCPPTFPVLAPQDHPVVASPGWNPEFGRSWGHARTDTGMLELSLSRIPPSIPPSLLPSLPQHRA